MSAEEEDHEPQRKSGFAGHEGVLTLYRFERFPAGDSQEQRERREWVRELLKRGRLYFPVASQLNDPFEASPAFTFPTTLVELLDGYQAWATRNGRPADEIAAQKAHLTEKFQDGRYRQEAEAALLPHRHRFRNETPLCCFSATRRDVPMWSYYADSHKGLCIHFDSREPSPFAVAQRVIYQREYPVVPIPIAERRNELIEAALLTKSCAWAHEREYRMVNLAQDEAPMHLARRIYDGVFLWEGQTAILRDPRLIVGVSLGASMASEHIEELLKICYERQPRLPVEIASPTRDSFDLSFAPLR